MPSQLPTEAHKTPTPTTEAPFATATPTSPLVEVAATTSVYFAGITASDFNDDEDFAFRFAVADSTPLIADISDLEVTNVFDRRQRRRSILETSVIVGVTFVAEMSVLNTSAAGVYEAYVDQILTILKDGTLQDSVEHWGSATSLVASTVDVNASVDAIVRNSSWVATSARQPTLSPTSVAPSYRRSPASTTRVPTQDPDESTQGIQDKKSTQSVRVGATVLLGLALVAVICASVVLGLACLRARSNRQDRMYPRDGDHRAVSRRTTELTTPRRTVQSPLLVDADDRCVDSLVVEFLKQERRRRKQT